MTVHELGEEHDPDLTYTFDPALVTDRGVIALWPGKPNRVGEEVVIERWLNARGVPTRVALRVTAEPRAATRSGWTSTPSASAARFAPTAPAPSS